MPVLTVFTNVAKDKVPSNLLKELTQTIHELLGKPLKVQFYVLQFHDFYVKFDENTVKSKKLTY